MSREIEIKIMLRVIKKVIDLYYFMKVQYKGKQVIQPIPIYKISKAWDYKFYYSKEMHKGNYANDQIVARG